MDPRKRIVTQLPLDTLWDNAGELQATRTRSLDRDGVRGLLSRGPVRFVIANGGHPLRWIPPSERFSVWKTEVEGHLATGDRIDLDQFQNGLAYLASEWVDVRDDVPIVLLEAHH
jgi:hypothetical protein